MKKPAKKQKHLPYWPILCLVALLVMGGVVYAYHRHTQDMHTASKNAAGLRPVNTPSYTPANPQDNAENNARKASSNPAATLDNGPSANSDSSLSAQIVSASANSGNIHIGTMVSGTTSGICTITATQGQTTTTLETISIKQDVNSYDCGGGAINVATSQLNPSSGTWQLKLTVTAGRSKATDAASVTL